MSSLPWLAWIWIPITLWAAFAQTVRNAAQRTLISDLGTLAATLVRFLYGLPLAAAWVLGTCVLGDRPGLVPVFTPIYAAWLALGAVTQVAATAFVLLAMKERNFILAVAYSKTEVLQVALFSAVLLNELPGPLALAAMAAATCGVVLLSLPRGGWRLLLSGGAPGQGRLVACRLASGACFAIASVGFRGASLALGDGVAPWVAGGWGVLWAQLLQTVLLGGWLLARQPGVARAIGRAWKLSMVAAPWGRWRPSPGSPPTRCSRWPTCARWGWWRCCSATPCRAGCSAKAFRALKRRGWRWCWQGWWASARSGEGGARVPLRGTAPAISRSGAGCRK